jgi:lactate dehydrogenase-like 2-hydroxyacid dehydrogenase
MKIIVLENIKMTDEQRDHLSRLGVVQWFNSSTEDEAKVRIKGADVVVVDWVDPSPFILAMKSPSLIALMSTGFEWIKNRDEAKKRRIFICNVPSYATEAVAEHLFGLTLCVIRQTMVGDRNIRMGKKEKGYLEGIELKGKTMGVIGLGHIGNRVVEIAKVFGMNVITYNRHPKSMKFVKDVSLEELLSSSDVITVCCSLNESSRRMLDAKRLSLMKNDSIIVSTTWDVIVLDDLIELLKTKQLRGAGLDVAVEGNNIELKKEYLTLDNLVLTPHIGYNTIQAKVGQVDICISNIENYIAGTPINIVN